MAGANATSRANIERFDSIAAGWDANPRRVALARAVASAILAQVKPTGIECAMEFGCGTGLVTGLLAPHLGQVLAADNSVGMLDVLRDKLRQHGIHNVEVLQADLSERVPDGPYDLIFSSMVMHHIADVAGLLVGIHDALTPGGRIALADLELEDGTFHSADTPGIMHWGFAPEVLTDWAQTAGFLDIEIVPVHQTKKEQPDGTERTYTVQLMTGRRPK
jgi:SAM-dependent methyltransferase